jgi:uncharacterized protein (TIGR02145 family)
LVGYDFSRTIVKYGNIFPYSIDYIMILASAPAIAEENKMRDDFNLFFWWSGVLSFHGVIKGNRITGKSIWPDDFITDIDGNIYTSVVIGTQRWLEQNLKVTKYRNGDPITNITNNATWAARAAEAYRWYLDDPITYAAYGILYNFWVVADARGIAPVGYHIATSAEWVIMNTFLGGTGFAGGHLKEAGLSHWSTPNTGADNSSGFTGLGAGYIHSGTGVAENNKSWTVFWTSTEVDATTAIAYALDLLSDDVTPLMTDLKKRGGSIRCIKD